MRILIIGGAGFLGSHLCGRFISEGHEVAILDNLSGSIKYRLKPGPKLVCADACHLTSAKTVFDSFSPEIIFSCVSYYFDNRYNFFEDCRITLSSANVLTRLLTKDVKHVYYCSSSDVYGGPNSRGAIKESRKIIQPENHIGVAKLSAEQLVSFRCSELDVPFTALRIFDLFGPRIKYTSRNDVVNWLIDNFLAGEQVGIKGGSTLRDYIYIDDAVEAISLLLKSEVVHSSVNLGSGKGTKLKDICGLLSTLLDITAPPAFIPEGKIKTYSQVADISILKSLKWEPTTSISDKKTLSSLIDFRRKEVEFNNNPAAVLQAMRK